MISRRTINFENIVVFDSTMLKQDLIHFILNNVTNLHDLLNKKKTFY